MQSKFYNFKRIIQKKIMEMSQIIRYSDLDFVKSSQTWCVAASEATEVMLRNQSRRLLRNTFSYEKFKNTKHYHISEKFEDIIIGICYFPFKLHPTLQETTSTSSFINSNENIFVSIHLKRALNFATLK